MAEVCYTRASPVTTRRIYSQGLGKLCSVLCFCCGSYAVFHFVAAASPAGWSIAKQASEVDELQAAADRAAAQAAAAAGAETLRSLEDLDAELGELERQQRATDLAREELNRRQARIKVTATFFPSNLLSSSPSWH